MTRALRLIALSMALALCATGSVVAKTKSHKSTGTTAASSAASAPAASSDPVKTVESFHAALLDSMKHAKELGVQGRYNRLAPAVDAAFDFQAMTQAIVGPDWATMPAGDRKAITDAFRRTTIAGYARNFDGYNGEQFVTNPQAQDRGGEKVVSSQMTRPSNAAVPFIYKLDNHGGWKIDDVYANGFVSQVATKRSEYAATLKAGGAASLAQKLNALADANLKGG
ncbi:MAG TPA: ABC transporter substrate-binding protein [Rhizomicrobium sp.]|jgi:phospholipid transport system substrate-binding protein